MARHCLMSLPLRPLWWRRRWRVAKHGNRSITSVSGSADVLEAAGVNLGLTPEQVARCLNSWGRVYVRPGSSLRHANTRSAPRKELGLADDFNVLGPMTNPAG